MPKTFTCTNAEKVPVNIIPVDIRGKKAPVDGPIRVTVQSGDGTVTPVDAENFLLISGDAIGDTIYLVEADPDSGYGVDVISDTITLTVTSSPAVAFEITAGAPIPKSA